MAATTVPNTFVNGALADADDVNANFTEAARAINDEVVHRDGSTPMTAALDAGGFKVTSLGTPTAATDAATKAYVDAGDTLADDAVTTAKIADDAVTYAKIAEIVAVTYTGTTDTLALSDSGCVIYYSNSALVTVTIPTNASVAFPTGTEMVLMSTGAGGVTLTTTSLTLLPTTPKKSVALGEAMFIKKVDTDTWIVIGGTSA